MLHVENRELVVPGQLIAEDDYKLWEGVYRDAKRIYSSMLGLVDLRGRNLRVIPLQGRYIPKREDAVIGIVTDILHWGWILDVNSPYEGSLFASDFLLRKVDLIKDDISRYLDVGDAVMLKVKDVDELMRVKLEAAEPRAKKMQGGKLLGIQPAKIPRVVGRKGSMLATLQEVSGCRLKVGQNGRIMIWGGNFEMTNAVVEALLMIEREAHTTGLTDRVRLMLEKKRGGEHGTRKT